MIYRISHIAKVLVAETRIVSDITIEHLLFDSRKVFTPATSLFFALKGSRRDGHGFIPELYEKGVRCFVISEHVNTENYPEANLLKVRDSLEALQQLAIYHRSLFSFPVIGITGSNGKTIVKEWLYQLLHEDYNIVRSPKSYNSQIGVPLSIWEMKREQNLGIFEAGISRAGEMEKLQEIIQPAIGILTNIGEAHSEGFNDADQKAREKIKLFENAKLVIYSADDWLSEKAIILKCESAYQKTGKYPFSIFSWGRLKKADLQILEVNSRESETEIIAFYKNAEISITIPFTDEASIQNAITCWCVLLHLRIPDSKIAKRMKTLQAVNMRLELKKGINHCTLINDSYSADLSSLLIALNFLLHKGGSLKKTVILSDFFQTNISAPDLYKQIAAELVQHEVDKVIGIGMNISKYLKVDSFPGAKQIKTEYYPSTQDFISHIRFSDFREEAILVKGARLFRFEQISSLLELKAHQTELEINLNAIAHNLVQFQSKLQPDTKMMVMVKAFAYGSGGAEIANTLQFHKIDYLGVAYADEGVELRRSGIKLPLMVMNAERESFEKIVNHQLEPVIFSFNMLKNLDDYFKQENIHNYPVHLEIETGMNRLGFLEDEMEKLYSILKNTSSLHVKSVFSHLAASEDPSQDLFTQYQYNLFLKICEDIQKFLGYPFLRHISNSAAILRHPQMHLDMVRLGIGLYGVDNTDSNDLNLLPVATLKSTVAQVKKLKSGETISYNRKGVLTRDSVIATINIGYADGYNRRLSNGVGKIWVKGHLAPVLGSICMDMTMVDVTDIQDVKEGDEVIIFGKELSIKDLASWSGTIPYEIMTGISQRVKRVYFEE